MNPLQAVAPDVFRATRPQSYGWENAMYVLRLADGSLLVHSATDLGEGTFEAIRKLGDVRWLFAPNHFHHLGIPAYRRVFPGARAIAAPGAVKRLRAKGVDAVGLDTVDVPLPAGAGFLVAEGTKSGETILVWPGEGGPTWIVCDAFFNVPSLSGFPGAVLRALRTGPGLALGKTFEWLVIGDRERYRSWIHGALDAGPPARMFFSHGEPLTLAGAEPVRSLLTSKFGPVRGR
ncbi:MAG: hypothetical protein U0169_08325 [Polyangiaceae bacterium]